MFNWFRKKKEDIHKDCHQIQIVTQKRFKMIRGSSRRTKTKPWMSVAEIQSLLNSNEQQCEDIAFYIESKCKHGVVHNNRIFLWSEKNNFITVVIQRPQDICLCISYFKTIKLEDFKKYFEDVSLLVSKPQAVGFMVEKSEY